MSKISDYLKKQEELFDEFENVVEDIEKIDEASILGNKILEFIDETIENTDFEVINDLNIEKIVDDLNIQIKEEIDGDNLKKIYDEITDTFRKGGKISLKDYLTQGEIVKKDLLNNLKGVVDYSVRYSEKELKKREKEAFERFNMVVGLNNLKELSECFDVSREGQIFINKSNEYLDYLDSVPIPKSIEERLSEIENIILLEQSMENMGCTLKNPKELNNFISDRMADIVEEVGLYKDDSFIKSKMKEIYALSNDFKDNEVISNLHDKMKIINENIFENELNVSNKNDLNL